MKRLILYALFFISIANINAAPIDFSSLLGKQKVDSVALYKAQCDSLMDIIDGYRKKEAQMANFEAELKHRTDSLNEEIKKSKALVAQSDSVAKEITKIDNIKNESDYNAAIYCDQTLLFRNEKEDIDFALELWGKIEDEDVKKEFAGVGTALRNYKMYFDQVYDVIKAAQSDDKWKNFPMDPDKYKNMYRDQMNGTDYMKMCYSPSTAKKADRKQGTIRYLNQKIDLFLKLLKDGEPGKYDFSIILFEMNPNYNPSAK